MDWIKLERWVTLALYSAALVAATIMLAERLLPEGTPAQRAAAVAAEFLSELGSIAGGAIIVIILIVIGGTLGMALLTKGVDLYREMRGRNDQLRAEGIAIGKEMGLEQGLEQGREQGLEQGREQGLEQGREQGQAEIRARLREVGVDLDELLRSDADEAESSDGNGDGDGDGKSGGA